MPRLWDHTIDTHRDAVRSAILDAAWTLAAEHGLTSVTMAGVARTAGIGRATLYRYFADPEAILRAWHERQVTLHLARLEGLAAGREPPLDRLGAVLGAWGHILRQSGRHGADMGRLLHGGGDTEHAHHALASLVAGLLREGVADGSIRRDAPPEELATFCLHALSASGTAPSEDTVERLAAMTLDGVRST
jgi:AcrR family transcriptional regulator